LGTTIRKIHTVFTIGGITITVLMLFKVGTRVVIKDSITIFVVSRGIISRLMVRISMVSGPVGGSRGMVDRSRLVGGSRGMVDRGSFVNGSRLIGRSRGMVDRCVLVGRSWVVDGSWVVDRGRGMVVITMKTGRMVVVSMGKGMIVVTMGTGMVSMSGGMDGDMAWGIVGSNVFLLILVLVYLIRGGSRLTVHNSMGVSMGFVD